MIAVPRHDRDARSVEFVAHGSEPIAIWPALLSRNVTGAGAGV